MKFAKATHVGRVRQVNEDYLLVKKPIFIVADGMGGHSAGEVASKIAAETAYKVINSSKSKDKLALLKKAVEEANKKVIEKSVQLKAKNDMGTTFTLALIDSQNAYLSHIGDSRAYLLRKGKIKQITEDHSLVAEMVKQGKLSKSQARKHPYRNVITRAIGSEEKIKVDLLKFELMPGDRLLLTSDGLTGLVKDSKIKEIISKGDLDKACSKLVGLANEKGGHDNISVILVEIEDRDLKVSGVKNNSMLKRRIAFLLLGLLIIASPIFTFLYIKNHSYYLAADKGRVVLYQGFPFSLYSLKFSKASYVSNIPTKDIDRSMKRRLTKKIIVRNRKEGLDAIRDIRKESVRK